MHTKLRNFSNFIFLTLVFLCPTKITLAEDKSEETQRVILALFAAFNRHDTEALVELYSEAARIRSPGDIEPRIGREVVREIYAGHFENIPGVHDAVQNIIVEGDQGSVEFIASWDQPTDDDPNARGNLRIASFITVKNGKITQDITYFDRLELAEKMDIGVGE
ncbi:MAG: nuclear transport factor 2 family protein [Woeseiaceae bacterium]